MLETFIQAHRAAILERARSKIELRLAPRATYTEITNGIPLFLDQLCVSLAHAQGDTVAIVASATRHGSDLERMGFTVTQVVHDYGDICQAVTEIASENETAMSTDEFRILNKCLDDAIAGAVTEYARVREGTQRDVTTARLGLTHELRNKLSAATLAHMAIKAGGVGIRGSTGAVLERNLRGMRELIDGVLAAVRIESGIYHREVVSVWQVVEEIEADAALEAVERGVTFFVEPIEQGIEIEVDRSTLAAAVINLLHNAFKFSKLGGHITLKVTGVGDRVLFAVQDECGGIKPGTTEDIFLAFVQRGDNRTGMGLGLSISRRGVEADGGTIAVTDLPGTGCIFTISMPRIMPKTRDVDTLAVA